MDEGNNQGRNQIGEIANKAKDGAKDLAKKTAKKGAKILIKLFKMLPTPAKVAVIVILVILLIIVIACVEFIIYNEKNDGATKAVNNAIGSDPMKTIVQQDENKYKIEYTNENGETTTGKDAINEILKEHDMNFEDFNEKEIECLYKALKADWATNYPNLGDNVDNSDLDSINFQGVITIKRASEGKEPIKLEYKPYDEFSQIKDKSVLSYFSMKDGFIVIANWNSTEVIYQLSENAPDDVKNQYVNTGEQVNVTETLIDYKNVIGVHTFSFEVALSLLVTSEDIDFINDFIDLGFNSTIEITVHDNIIETITVEKEHIEEKTKYKKWVDYQIIEEQQEILASGEKGRGSRNTRYKNNEEINSTEEKKIDYTLTTKRITKNNSYIVGLTKVSSWIADIEDVYDYNQKVGQEVNLGLGSPTEYIVEQDIEEIIPPNADSEVVAFKNSKQSTSTTVDSYNNSKHTTTITCAITGARKKGTLTGKVTLEINTSKTNEYRYEKRESVTTDSNSNTTSESSEQTNNEEKRNIIFLGDSRTVQMHNYIYGGNTSPVNAKEGNEIYIAKGSMGYNWFESTGMVEANEYLKSGNTDLVILMGVNDILSPGAADNYVKYINNHKNELTENGNRVFFCSVNPVGHINGNNEEVYTNQYGTWSNTGNIREFNETLKKGMSRYVHRYI